VLAIVVTDLVLSFLLKIIFPAYFNPYFVKDSSPKTLSPKDYLPIKIDMKFLGRCIKQFGYSEGVWWNSLSSREKKDLFPEIQRKEWYYYPYPVSDDEIAHNKTIGNAINSRIQHSIT
jgi:hypothetical protein